MKELFYLEWIIFDNCNLNCSYCVTKGDFSHKEKNNMSYIPGREIDIAHRIVELRPLAKNIVVNLTGGEPLLALRIKEVISILKTAGIRVNLISNFSLMNKIADVISDLDSILISLHVRHRTKDDVENLIRSINEAKEKSNLSLSQVDHDLNADDKKILSYISAKTGMKIRWQPFIPRWNEKGRIENSQALSNKTFISSFGKRCSLGYLYFLLVPDGTFYYGLWCDAKSQKTGNMLAPLPENLEAFSAKEMDKCRNSSCVCNYNTFYYEEYRTECKKLGYKREEIFGKRNIKPYYMFLDRIHRIPDILLRASRNASPK